MFLKDNNNYLTEDFTHFPFDTAQRRLHMLLLDRRYRCMLFQILNFFFEISLSVTRYMQIVIFWDLGPAKPWMHIYPDHFFKNQTMHIS